VGTCAENQTDMGSSFVYSISSASSSSSNPWGIGGCSGCVILQCESAVYHELNVGRAQRVGGGGGECRGVHAIDCTAEESQGKKGHAEGSEPGLER
jgi:hypothetical protein